jgi:hypothetical protein
MLELEQARGTTLDGDVEGGLDSLRGESHTGLSWTAMAKLSIDRI